MKRVIIANTNSGNTIDRYDIEKQLGRIYDCMKDIKKAKDPDAEGISCRTFMQIHDFLEEIEAHLLSASPALQRIEQLIEEAKQEFEKKVGACISHVNWTCLNNTLSIQPKLGTPYFVTTKLQLDNLTSELLAEGLEASFHTLLGNSLRTSLKHYGMSRGEWLDETCSGKHVVSRKCIIEPNKFRSYMTNWFDSLN